MVFIICLEFFLLQHNPITAFMWHELLAKRGANMLRLHLDKQELSTEEKSGTTTQYGSSEI